MRIGWLLGIFLVLSSASMVAAAPSAAPSQSIKLFDPVPFTVSPGGYYTFGTKNVSVTFEAGQTAVISSTSDGTGSFVTDNYVIVNGTRICPSGCYGPYIGPAIIGNPIDTVRAGVGPIDVTALIPTGTSTVSVELLDTLGNYGSTEIWLVIDGGTTRTASTNEDPDGDGISGSRDNCPYDYNPDQEDGWGSDMGDLCDTDWYNRTGAGMSGFVQKNGVFNLHGNCIYLEDGAPRCPVIAAFDPNSFDPANAPMEFTSGDAGTWSVWLYYLYSANGVDVYQVNTYSTNPPQPDTLVDDRLEIHVTGSTWQWYHRGGASMFHGI